MITLTTKKRSLKRNDVPSSDFEYDVKLDVQDIMTSAKLKSVGEKIPANVSEVPIENIPFHPVEKVMCFTGDLLWKDN